MGSPGPADSDQLKQIRESFLRQLPSQLAGIQEAHETCGKAGATRAELESLFRLIHNLKGASAAFRLGPLSEVAREGEQLAAQALKTGAGVDETWYEAMRNAIVRMRLASTRSESIPVEPPPLKGSELPAPVSLGENRKRVFLCDDDPFQGRTMADQIRCFGFDVHLFEALEPLRKAVEISPPDAIVMDVMFPSRPLGGPETMGLLQAGRAELIPTVFISSQNDLSFRLSAVRAGSSAYMVKPVNITELCSKLARLTSTESPDPCRVLIVDDDFQLAEYHAQILREAGMEARIVTDPLLTMGPLLEMRPDLILMDMYMPSCNGMELAKTIRQISAFLSIPIVFLSSETDEDMQFNAMFMGGDEFLTKPIKPHHLITAVAVRAERMKILRSFLVRDSMTELFNHTATKEFLDTAIADARRTGKELCFAMIDVDKFKAVNDTHGHAMGDRVLIALSRLLQQRLRHSDIVGRFGGEEFAVVLPECELPRAIAILDDLRESFSAITYHTADSTFTSTFSVGVAAWSMHPDPTSLCKAADEALYQAKHRGRNQVVAAPHPKEPPDS